MHSRYCSCQECADKRSIERELRRYFEKHSRERLDLDQKVADISASVGAPLTAEAAAVFARGQR